MRTTSLIESAIKQITYYDVTPICKMKLLRFNFIEYGIKNVEEEGGSYRPFLFHRLHDGERSGAWYRFPFTTREIDLNQSHEIFGEILSFHKKRSALYERYMKQALHSLHHPKDRTNEVPAFYAPLMDRLDPILVKDLTYFKKCAVRCLVRHEQQRLTCA